MAATLTVDHALAADYALRVEAPAECADEARLLEALRERAPGFTPAPWDTPGASRFVVRFLPGASGVLVELETTDASGARSLRSVPAQDCPEALRASAWILTLLVDPAAAATADPAAATTADPAAAATAGPAATTTADPAATTATAGAPVETPPAPETSEPAAQPTPARTTATRRVSSRQSLDSPIEPVPEPAPPPPRLWHISVGGFAGVLQSGLPETPFGFGFFVEAAWERKSWFRPSARLAGLDAGSGVGHTERGDVEVSWVGARLSLCPVRSARTRLVSVRFCALGELGRLSGEGQATTDQGSATPTWYAAGPSLGLELQPSSFLALELDAAVVFPFNRDRFVFEPEPVEVGYEVPPLSLSLALGIAGRY